MNEDYIYDEMLNKAVVDYGDEDQNAIMNAIGSYNESTIIGTFVPYNNDIILED